MPSVHRQYYNAICCNATHLLLSIATTIPNHLYSSYPPYQMLMNVTLTMADVTTCVTIPLGATTAHVDQDTHYKKMASLVWVSTVWVSMHVDWKVAIVTGFPLEAMTERMPNLGSPFTLSDSYSVG